MFINITEISQSYVGGGTYEAFATLAALPVEETREFTSEEVEYDSIGGRLSGSGCERAVETCAVPWHSSACSPRTIRKAIRRRLREMRVYHHVNHHFGSLM